MNRSQIEAAIERNLPFTLHMADGKSYSVPHRDYVFLPPKAAFVVVSDGPGSGVGVTAAHDDRAEL